MPYTTTTLGDALADLGNRLMDPNHVRWPAEELILYVQQGLRTYNALTNHFRETASFVSTVNQAFYDLPTVLPTLRAQDYTVSEAITQIAYMLLEPPPVGNFWSGTLQYSLSDLMSALQQARDTFLMETGIVQTRSVMVIDPTPGDGLIDLSENVVNVRRLAWRTDDGVVTLLRRADQWALTNYFVDWQTATALPPKGYSVSTQPPLQVQLAPFSTVPGQLELLTVDRGAVPNLLIPGQSLGVPNDWAWVVIYGALAQLFQRDGIALDMGRAGYCDQRWQHGLKMAKQAAVVLAAQISGVSCTIGAVHDADTYAPTWEMVSATPLRVLTAGHTVVALCPPPGIPPGGGQFTVTLQVVRNAPVPVAIGDYLQVGPEVLNDLLDYVQHTALLKEGVGQTQGSQGLLDQFMALCGTTLAIQWGSQPNEVAASSQTSQDAESVAYQVQ